MGTPSKEKKEKQFTVKREYGRNWLMRNGSKVVDFDTPEGAQAAAKKANNLSNLGEKQLNNYLKSIK